MPKTKMQIHNVAVCCAQSISVEILINDAVNAYFKNDESDYLCSLSNDEHRELQNETRLALIAALAQYINL